MRSGSKRHRFSLKAERVCSCLEGGRDGLLVLSGSLGSESEHVDRLVASESSSPVLGDLVVLIGEVGLGGRDEGGESGLMRRSG